MNGEIRTSVKAGSDRLRVPSGASRPLRYGDKIFVKVVNVQQCWRTVAEFNIDNVADMSDIYGELRYRTRGERGLTRLYVRNLTQGWSFEQPFKLYGRPEPKIVVKDYKDPCCDSQESHWRLGGPHWRGCPD